MKLEEYRVAGAPSTVYYVPDFISSDQETSLLQSISSTPGPRWTQLSNRKVP